LAIEEQAFCVVIASLSQRQTLLFRPSENVFRRAPPNETECVDGEAHRRAILEF
jgi:hypothetical protein